MPDFVTYKDYANGTLEASGNRLTLVKTGLAVGLARDLVVAEGVVVTYAVEFSQWNSQRNCAWFGVADVTSAQPKGWTIDGHGQIFEMDLAHLNSDTDQEWNLYKKIGDSKLVGSNKLPFRDRRSFSVQVKVENAKLCFRYNDYIKADRRTESDGEWYDAIEVPAQLQLCPAVYLSFKRDTVLLKSVTGLTGGDITYADAPRKVFPPVPKADKPQVAPREPRERRKRDLPQHDKGASSNTEAKPIAKVRRTATAAKGKASTAAAAAPAAPAAPAPAKPCISVLEPSATQSQSEEFCADFLLGLLKDEAFAVPGTAPRDIHAPMRPEPRRTYRCQPRHRR